MRPEEQVKLKPCPFCGKDDGGVAGAGDDDDGIWNVGCAYCDCEGPPGWSFHINPDLLNLKSFRENPESCEEAAIFIWNKRPTED